MTTNDRCLLEKQDKISKAEYERMARGNGPACNPWEGASPDEIAEEFEWATDAQEAHQGDDGYDDAGEE